MVYFILINLRNLFKNYKNNIFKNFVFNLQIVYQFKI